MKKNNKQMSKNDNKYEAITSKELAETHELVNDTLMEGTIENEEKWDES